MTERNTNSTSKRVLLESGKGFLVMKKSLKQKGITSTASSPYCFECNRLSENMSRASPDKAQYLLKESKHEKRYWGKVEMHAAFLHNVTAQMALKKRTPHEVLFRGPPNKISNRKIWVFIVFIRSQSNQEFEASRQCTPWSIAGTRTGLFRIHLQISNRIIEIKHVGMTGPSILAK